MSKRVYSHLGQGNGQWSYARITKSSFVLLAVHILATCGALTIIFLNLHGLWIGKELTGSIKQDGEKLLALQLTSKLHELLILTSLSDVLFTHILHRFSVGKALPMAMLTAGLSFRDISYLWSSEFLAIVGTSFSKKRTILVLIASATILGVLVGPSSATAISPKFDDWMTGNLRFTLNSASEQLWPLVPILDGTHGECGGTEAPCALASTSRVLAENLFSYWGHETPGGMFALPEKVNIKGSSSLRNMNGRFRGPLNLYQPQYTTATVQTAVIADAVNTLRMMWYRANSNQCAHATPRGICSYKDITWSIDASQPVVYTACIESDPNALPSFPIIDHTHSASKTAQYNKTFAVSNSTQISQLRWLPLEGEIFGNMSAGVVVQPAHANGRVYSCSVKAQWASSTIQTSFLNGAYAVDGTPPYFEAPMTEGSTYSGQTLRLTPDWSDATFSFSLPELTNTTGFDLLLQAGTSTPDVDEAAKIEAVIAVLLAEALAQIRHDTSLVGTLNDPADLLQTSGPALQIKTFPTQSTTLLFRTVVTGYAYGMRTASSVSVSVLLSLFVLFTYTVITVWHLISTKCLVKHEVQPWRGTIDLLGLTLNSPPNSVTKSMSCGIKDVSALKLPVTITTFNNNAELDMGLP